MIHSPDIMKDIDVLDILHSAKTEGVKLFVEDGKLGFRKKKEAKVPAHLIEQIKAHQAQIITFIERGTKTFTKIPALVAGERPVHIPLSFAQERLWFIDQLEGTVAYHMPEVLRITGSLNIPVLQAAIKALVERHESLRTVFRDQNGIGYQYVMDSDGFEVDIVTGLDKWNTLTRFLEDVTTIPFKLDSDYMLKATILSESDNEHLLILVLHHIASDGWSLPILVKEIETLYQSMLTGKASPLAVLPLQYADYSIWQREYLSGEVLANKLTYWEDQLGGSTPLSIPTDFARQPIRSKEGAVYDFTLDAELTTALNEMSQKYGTTLFMCLLSIYKVLLYRYTGQLDISVGTPIANREQTEVSGMIGYFANTIVLRDEFSSDDTFLDLLEQVKQTCLSGYENQDVPFERIVDHLSIPRDQSQSPLFQTMLVLQNNESVSEFKLGDSEVELVSIDNSSTRFDITFDISEEESGLSISVEYATQLFKQETIVRMASHFEQLTRSIVNDPTHSVGALKLLSESEEHQLLEVFNATKVPYQIDQTVISLYAEQVQKTPDAVAVAFQGRALTYKELDEESNRLATYLVDQGVEKETLVPICIERSLEMIIGILSILKAGGAYVPIDPKHPHERIDFILKDTAANMVLTQSGLSSIFKDLESTKAVVLLDQLLPELQSHPKKALTVNISPEQLVYVIYTSGTTGVPKGVMIQHKALNALLYSFSELYPINQGDKIALKTNYGFDVSVHELFGWIKGGGTMVIFPEGLEKDVKGLLASMKSHEITHFNIVPSLFSVILEELKKGNKELLSNLKYFFSCGEALPLSLVYSYNDLDIQALLENIYGPTEATVYSTYYSTTQLEQGHKSVPIGKPLPNTQIYVLDARSALVPIGVVGELCIGGAQLAKGYLNRPELTKEKFIPHPFKEDGYVYRTGDVARWLSDGNMEYMGRNDDQVKIRGHRIELLEIEAVIDAFPQVKQSVVLARNDEQGGKNLVGYLLADESIDVQMIQKQLRKKVPEYMIPRVFVTLDAFPLNASGKIDKKALPEPNATSLSGNDYVGPTTQEEIKLAQVWKEILGFDTIGIHDNFFELGGDSIKAIQLVSKSNALNLHYRVKDVFNHQTIAEIVAHLREATAVMKESGVLEGNLELHPVQKMFFDQDWVTPNHFNQSALLTISKSVTQYSLDHAVKELVLHHDALRLQFEKKESESFPVQQYGVNIPSLIEQEVLTMEEVSAICDQHQRALDLQKGSIVKFVWIKTPNTEESNRLFITVHHLAIDGISWRILLEDITTLLTMAEGGTSVSMPSKATSYRQWTAKLQEYANSPSLLSEQFYWKTIFTEGVHEVAALEEVPSITYAQTKHCTTQLDESGTKALLHEINWAYGTEINDILLSALSLALSVLKKETTAVIALEGHGREELFDDMDISRTVGWFTSLYPVLLEVSNPETELSKLITGTKDMLRGIPNKGLGFGILRYLGTSEETQESLSRPFDDIVFNYLGDFDNGINSEEPSLIGIASESYGAEIGGKNVNRSSLSINSMIIEGKLQLDVSYNELCYSAATMQAFSDTYLKAIEKIIVHCKSIEEVVKSPSDYGLPVSVTYDELTTFKSLPTHLAPISDVYLLSPLQEGILFHSLYDNDPSAYVVQVQCDLVGSFSRESFDKSWAYLIEKHSIFRTGIFTEGISIPVQCVYEEVGLPISYFDYSHLSGKALKDKLDAFLEEDKNIGFSLHQAPLFRITLLQLQPGRLRLVFTNHHILYDGWSFSKLISNFMECYTHLETQKGLPTILTDDYSEHIRSIISKNKAEGISYWKDYLAEVSSPSYIPFVSDSLQRNRVFGNKEKVFTFSSNLQRDISAFSERHSITINTLFQGVWMYLLSKYTGQDTVVFGATVSGRDSGVAHIEDKIGLYINTIPVCSSVRGDQKILDWLHQLQSTHTTGREEYNHLPLSTIELQSVLGGALFDSIMVFENFPIEEIGDSVRTGVFSIDNVIADERTNYTLSISIFPSEEDLSIKLIYNDQILSAATIDMIQGHIERLLVSFLSGVKRVAELEYITLPEEHKLLEVFNATEATFPQGETVVNLYREQAKSTPDAIAVVLGDSSLTYRELDERSNQLAHYLQTKGVEKETLVPICLERSLEMVIGILGILKAGGAYVPIDPSYPHKRIAYMLQDTSATMVLTSKKLIPVFSEFNEGLKIIALDDLTSELKDISNIPPEIEIDVDQLVYVMYTSGTTGVIKGALIEQKGIIRLCHLNELPLNKDTRIVQLASISFDAATFEIWCSLLKGGTLVLYPHMKVDIPLVNDVIREHEVNTVWMTSGLLDQWVHSEISNLPLRYVLSGGDVLSPSSVAMLQETLPEVSVINGYGPTENTTFTTCYNIPLDFDTSESIPIGTPITGTSVYILDKNLNLVPVGVPGQLYTSGAGLSRGYLNHPELTEEKFVSHPFQEGERLYKTGDIAKWQPDGNIEFMGREDHQVKIRGFRIELGEIESALDQLKEVKQSIVIAREDSMGGKQLVVYLTQETQVDSKNIQKQLEEMLPEYMVPKLYMILDSFPLTKNGKVDRRKLPVPNDSAYQKQEYVPPSNEIEAKLVEIWQELLWVEEIGIDDNFFELGGHSILAIRTMSRIQIELGIMVNIAVLFNNPTIYELSKALANTENCEVYNPIPKVPVQEYYEVSQAQTRVWIANLVTEDKTTYNITFGFEIKGNLDIEALHRAIPRVIERHEILRTNFIEIDGIPHQKIHAFKDYCCDFNRIETDNLEKKAQEVFYEESAYIFQLEEDQLIRFRLVTDGDRFIFIINLHHIVGDGWSALTLQKDVLTAYQQEKGQDVILEPLSIQYKEYAAWHNNLLESATNEDEQYWVGSLTGIANRTDLPTDKRRAAQRATQSKTHEFDLGEELSKKIIEAANAHGVSTFNVLQTLLKIYLTHYLKTSDVVIGTPVAGRNHPQLGDQIGFYVNILALRSQISKEDSFDALLSQISAETQKAFAHQSYPFDVLVRKLGAPRDMSRNELFDILISYTDGLDEEDIVDGLEFIEFEPPTKDEQNKYDITYSFGTHPSKIVWAAITYNTSLYFDSSIDEMKAALISVFESILSAPEDPINKAFTPHINEVSLVDDFS